LTVGIIPEALPIISIIALSRGAAAMAKRHVIVKRLSAINDLGSIDILWRSAGLIAPEPGEESPFTMAAE
jgi:magnesium-transporting ATPase (P-type)